MKLIKEQEREGLGEKLVFSIHKQASSSIQALSEWSVDNKARKKRKEKWRRPSRADGRQRPMARRSKDKISTVG